MATRFYLSSTDGNGGLTPAYAAWTRTSEAVRALMSPTKDGSALTNKTFWAGAAAAANDTCLCRQLLSAPMDAGIAFSTADTVKCAIRCLESAANDNINRCPTCIKVVSEDGATIRATLLALGSYGSTLEWGTAIASRNWLISGQVLGANYTTVSGDRLLIEVGGQVSAAAGVSVTGTMNFGSAAGTDLDETGGDTGADNPWFEISTNITFLPTFVRSVNDNVGVTDAAAPVFGFGRTIGDPVGLTHATISHVLMHPLTVWEYVERLKTTGPVAFWPMQEPASATVIQDVGSAANHAPLTNWSTTAGGPFGFDRHLENRDDTTRTATPPDIAALRFTDEFSIDVWVRCDYQFQGSIVVARRGFLGEYHFGIAYGFASGSYEFFCTLASGSDPRPYSAVAVPGDESWHHLAYTYDGTDFKGYIDGEIFTNETLTFVLNTTTGVPHEWKIGAADEGAFNFLGGQAYLRFHDHALTGDQIGDAYNDGLLVMIMGDRFNDSVGVTDPRALAFGTTVTDPVGLVDARTTVVGFARALADTVGLTDLAATTASFARSVADAVGLTDLAARVVAFIRAEAAAVGLIDTHSRDSGKTVSDAVGMTDSATRAATAARTQSDGVGLTDARTTAAGFGRTVTDPVGLTDTRTPAVGFGRTFNEAIGAADARPTLVNYVRQMLEALGVTDATTAARGHARTVTDPVGLADAMTRVATALLTLGDAVGLTDAISTDASGALSREINDSVGLADAMTRVATALLTLTDGVGISDARTAAAARARTVTDAVGLADARTAAAASARTISDPVGLADAIARAVGIARTANELVGLDDDAIDVLTPGGGGGVSLTRNDPVGLVDAMSTARGTARAFADPVGLADSMTLVRSTSMTLTDAVGILDFIRRSGGRKIVLRLLHAAGEYV